MALEILSFDVAIFRVLLMKPSTARPSFLDCLTVGTLTGVFTGLADATMIQNNLIGARGIIQFVPWTAWPASLGAWVTYAALASAVPALVPELRRYAAILAVITAPIMLAALRLTQFRHRFALRPSILLPIVVVLALLGAAAFWICRRWMLDPAFRVRLRPALFVCLLAGAASVAALVFQSPPSRVPANIAGVEGRSVVVIFLDTLRYDYSGVGDEAPGRAPNLHAFSSKSLNFEFAMAPAPWTLPSHVSMMTGVPSWELGLTPQQQTVTRRDVNLAERFARAGYRTAAYIANPILHDRTGFQIGMQTFEYAARNLDLCRTGLGVFLAKSSYTRSICAWTAADVSRRALRFLDQTSQPYFLVLNYVDPHDPYWLPPGHDATTDRRLSMRDHSVLTRVIMQNAALPQEDRERVLKIYGQAVRGMDASMKTLLERLDRDVEAGRTVVAVVGDHGEHFGEHNLCGHGNSVYATVLRVPMVIRAPGFQSMKVATPVSATHLHDALQHLARGRGSAASQPEIARLFTSRPAISHMFFTDRFRGANYLWSIFGDGQHLIESDTHRELYAIDDRDEVRDLAREGVAASANLVRALGTARRKAARPPHEKRPDEFKGLGYLP